MADKTEKVLVESDGKKPKSPASSPRAASTLPESRRGWAAPSPHSGLDINTVAKDTANYWIVRLPPEAAQDGDFSH